jgi:hypothetical protein
LLLKNNPLRTDDKTTPPANGSDFIFTLRVTKHLAASSIIGSWAESEFQL